MKKLLLLIAVSLFLISCENDFSPLAEYEEDFIVNAVLEVDSTGQKIYLTKTFNVDGPAPDEYNEPLNVPGADVSISNDGDIYFFQEVTEQVVRGGELQDLVYYVNTSLTPEEQEIYTLFVQTQDGSVLTSEMEIPNFGIFYIDNDLVTIPQEEEDRITLAWANLVTGNPEDMRIFFPRLILRYAVVEGADTLHMENEVPINFVERGGEFIANYPPITRDNLVIWDQAAFDRVLAGISEGDTLKSRYLIKEPYLELNVLNKTLGTYLSAIQTIQRDFTVRVAEPDLSNIQNGYGIFGAYKQKNFRLFLANSKVFEYGYRVY